jgi:hypothetical protein
MRRSLQNSAASFGLTSNDARSSPQVSRNRKISRKIPGDLSSGSNREAMSGERCAQIPLPTNRSAPPQSRSTLNTSWPLRLRKAALHRFRNSTREYFRGNLSPVRALSRNDAVRFGDRARPARTGRGPAEQIERTVNAPKGVAPSRVRAIGGTRSDRDGRDPHFYCIVPAKSTA